MEILPHFIEGIQELLVGRCFYFLDGLHQAVLCRYQVGFLLHDKLIALLHFGVGFNGRGIYLADIFEALAHTVILFLQVFQRRICSTGFINNGIEVNPKLYVEPLLHACKLQFKIGEFILYIAQ